jgi:7-keto-8-aminopelargonate synthetase-like enzyme
VNWGRAYIYSTAVPPSVPAVALEALKILAEEPQRQGRVRDLAHRVRLELRSRGLRIPDDDSPIIPIILGGEREALEAADRLRERGILVVAIRPPTVARGTSRLRITLSSAHTDDQIAHLVEQLGTLAVP